MARQRTRTKVFMGGGFEPDLATKFGQLCKEKGISIREGLRRTMIAAILAGRIEGVDTLELEEHRAHEKWGAATPTYDGEKKPSRLPNGKVAPAPPLE